MARTKRSKVFGATYKKSRDNQTRDEGCVHKERVNMRLMKLGSRHTAIEALIMDDENMRTSLHIQKVPISNINITIPNPMASLYINPTPENLTLVSSTVEQFLADQGASRDYDLVYLDFCSGFTKCFETVKLVSMFHLREDGTLAYTVCNRGVEREEIAFNALRHREMARNGSLHFDSCVAYRDMVTVIMTRGTCSIGQTDDVVCDHAQRLENGRFSVQRFLGWRVHRRRLEFQVCWSTKENTWEPATNLVEDLDRETFMGLVHKMK